MDTKKVSINATVADDGWGDTEGMDIDTIHQQYEAAVETVALSWWPGAEIESAIDYVPTSMGDKWSIELQDADGHTLAFLEDWERDEFAGKAFEEFCDSNSAA